MREPTLICVCGLLRVNRMAKKATGKEKTVAAKPAPKRKPGKTGKAGSTGSNQGIVLAEDGTTRLLSGGNPQIAKGYGDEPVKAYIAAMPGWKSELGRTLDALIERAVPDVYKAVKWNSPFYGVEGQGWFMSFHCFAKYVKVAFFKGASLDPLPPGESRQKDVRYLDIHETDTLDEAQFTDWARQASKLPGEKM
jgi:hypothetical protein